MLAPGVEVDTHLCYAAYCKAAQCCVGTRAGMLLYGILWGTDGVALAMLLRISLRLGGDGASW